MRNGVEWQCIKPVLRPRVNDSRDRHLVLRDGREGYHQRWTQYGKLLKTLHPLYLALAPTTVEFLIENQLLADAAAFGRIYGSQGPEPK
jgi:hypothetical protein